MLFEVIQGNARYFSVNQGRSRYKDNSNKDKGMQSKARKFNGINGN